MRQDKRKLEFTLGRVFCECSLKSMLAALGGIVCGGISLGSRRRRARKLFSGRDFGETSPFRPNLPFYFSVTFRTSSLLERLRMKENLSALISHM